METVEVVIKIPQKVYEDCIMIPSDIKGRKDEISKAFKNGTVLPEGHGRLCDMDAALECLQETADCEIKQYAIGMLDWAMSKRTIVEADRR